MTRNMLICDYKVNGYIENGIAVLEIFETLPHTKHRSFELEVWQELIHSSIGCLADKHEMPFFQKAHMGLFVEMERSPKFKAWDISNRAVNFTINNLKGIFFTDDDVEHLSIISAGRWSTNAKTTILLGEYITNYDRINGRIFEFLGSCPKGR